MFTLTFKENSWHAWIVDKFTPTHALNFNNLCSYFWIVMFGLFVFSIFASFVSALLVGFTFDIAWIFHAVAFVGNKNEKVWNTLSGFRKFWETCGIIFTDVLGICSIFAVIMGLIALADKRADKRTERRHNVIPKEPGFVRASYLTFKDKVCFRIKFE